MSLNCHIEIWEVGVPVVVKVSRLRFAEVYVVLLLPVNNSLTRSFDVFLSFFGG